MTQSRRDILAQGGKFLLLTGAAIAGLESLRGDAPQPAAKYKMAYGYVLRAIPIDLALHPDEFAEARRLDVGAGLTVSRPIVDFPLA